MPMNATDWEFKNRALIFGLIFGLSFPLYFVDPQNVTATLANWLGLHYPWQSERVARVLFLGATCFCVAGAVLRTWASSYLDANIVYANQIQTRILVAEGPYRFVRNPLYLANILMVIGMGSMMSRTGYAVAVILVFVFCYRLIFREEGDFQAGQSQYYARYRAVVPRLWPSLTPRVPTSGRQADWRAGLKAELWFWGFAAALFAYALTFSFIAYLVILAMGQLLFWLSSRAEPNEAP